MKIIRAVEKYFVEGYFFKNHYNNENFLPNKYPKINE